MPDGFYELIPAKFSLNYLEFLKDDPVDVPFGSPFKTGSWQNKAWNQVTHDIKWTAPSGFVNMPKSLKKLKRVAIQARTAIKGHKEKGRIKATFTEELSRVHGSYRVCDTTGSLEVLLTELYYFIKDECQRYRDSPKDYQSGKFQVRAKCMLIFEDGSAEGISGDPAKIFDRFNVQMCHGKIVIPVKHHR